MLFTGTHKKAPKKTGLFLIIWRPQPDLNRCCRRERPVSLAWLDDGDAEMIWGTRVMEYPLLQYSSFFGGPYWTRTSDSLLKRQILYRLS